MNRPSSMISTYRYGEPRKDFSLRIGVTRQPPRGVLRRDYRKKNYLDLWLRVLAPSPRLLGRYRKKHITFSEFKVGYLAEMSRAEPRQVIDLLALFSQSRPISLGCYCEREDQCHRSVLRHLVQSAEADIPHALTIRRHPNSSPVCYLEEEH